MNFNTTLSTNYLGLFGYTGNNAIIKNLGLVDLNITSKGGSIGGLVGWNTGTIMACFSTGVVNCGGNFIGGLVGQNSGTIISSYSTCDVYGYAHVGGLVGYNKGLISSCYSTGSITGIDNVGGLIGSHRSGIMEFSYSIGRVNGGACGGLVGDVTDNLFLGSVQSSFWDLNASGQTESILGRGLLTDQMKTLSIFANAGWINGDWVINDGLDYPHLTWENTPGHIIEPLSTIPLSGSGTAEDPYRITTAQEFGSLSWYSEIADKHIVLTTDLDLQGQQLHPIGEMGYFSGVFDGNNHKLIHASISRTRGWEVGLFNRLADQGQIMNLHVEDVTVVGDRFVGGVTGYNRGTIISCRSTGTITGRDRYVGGLTGYNCGAIWSSYNSGEVNGNPKYVGGLIGYNTGTLDSSVSLTEIVYPTDYAGGLAGWNDGEIAFCYSFGGISGLNDNIGGLVGYNNSGTILSSNNAGPVRGDHRFAGGIVGYNKAGKIISCLNTGGVIGSLYVGGIAGYDNTSILVSCYNAGRIVGGGYVGGLVGYFNSSKITSCYNKGEVSGSANVGGVIGSNYIGVMTACFNSGPVKGDHENIGGLVGHNYSYNILCCYNSGAVNGINGPVGGLVGWNDRSPIRFCYSVGKVNGSISTGGLVGRNDGQVYGSFWDIQNSSQNQSDGGVGKTTAEMKMLSTFTSTGWDFVGESANGTADVWRMCSDGVDYPRLAWEFSLGGDLNCPDGVELQDLLYLTERWMTATPETIGAADANGDGKVDLSDFAIVSGNWMRE